MRNPVFLKRIDAHLGPLVVRLLGLCRRRRAYPEGFAPRKVGILKIAAIGDTVLMSALISDLKQWRPDIEITLFTGLSNRDYASFLQDVDKHETLDFRKPIQLIHAVRRSRFDLFIDADSWPRVSAMITAITRSRFIVGFNCPGQSRHYAYDLQVPHSGAIHELDNYRNLLHAANIPTGSPPQAPSQWNPESHSDTIVFHLWPGGSNKHLKEWSFNAWQTLATKLLEEHGGNILLTGAPSDRERNEDFLASLPIELRSRIQNRAGISFKETLTLIQNSRLVVSVDTGIMHVAAAMGAPTVGLHGPTSPTRWGAIGQRVASILSHSPDSGHVSLGFDYKDSMNRMEGLSIEEIQHACNRLLSLVRKP